jgi:hypothetical protein
MSAEARLEGRVYSFFAAALLSSDPELAADALPPAAWRPIPLRRTGGRTFGVPRRLGARQWKVSFEMVVERVVNMGNHLHAVGAVGGVRVDLRLRSGDPMPSPGIGCGSPRGARAAGVREGRRGV